jgi:hypothetical protein
MLAALEDVILQVTRPAQFRRSSLVIDNAERLACGVQRHR